MVDLLQPGDLCRFKKNRESMYLWSVPNRMYVWPNITIECDPKSVFLVLVVEDPKDVLQCAYVFCERGSGWVSVSCLERVRD